MIPLALNTNNWTLQDFLTKIIKKDLGFEEPTLMLEGGNFIWEEGEDADSDCFAPNLTKKLPALPGGGIKHGTVMTIEDFSQDLTVDLTVTHQEVWEKEVEDEDVEFKFVVGGEKPVAKPSAPESTATSNGDSKAPAAEEEDDDDIIVVVSGENDEEAEGAKRPAEDNEDAPPTKKAKMAPNGDVEVIEIE